VRSSCVERGLSCVYFALRAFHRSRLGDISDPDFVFLAGASEIAMPGCNLPPNLSPLAFTHLRGIQRLDISGNKRVRLTDDILACLQVRSLSAAASS
jgi:hypothetical protein